jgi:antitoxin (DNA-binding transcriptional repressor) of toxin-antitoxin stability system
LSATPQKTVELTRRGQPVAVLIGRQEYVRLASRHRRFKEAYADFTREINLKELAINPKEVFSGARDGAYGREVDL